MTPIQQKHFLAGFDLAGQRQPDGTIKAYLGESTLDDWPDEVELAGNTYVKEDVIIGANGYESAQYV